MATIYEHTAGLVDSWVDSFGNTEMKTVTDDIIEILRICHHFRTPDEKKAPMADADELGEAICDYLQAAYGSPKNFDKEEEDTESLSDTDDSMPPVLDLPTE